MSEPTEVSTSALTPSAIGAARERVDGVAKVTGRARYAVENATDPEQPELADPLHLWLVTSTVARGRVTKVDAGTALAHPGVVAVLDHTSAPRLADTSNAELAILQDDVVHYRGQIVALVLAETSEAAREGAALVEIGYDAEPHHAELSVETATHAPESVNPDLPTDTAEGDVDAALAEAEVVVDATYRIARESNNPLEPHALLARWDDRPEGPRLTLHDSTQGVHGVASVLSDVLGLEPEQVRVRAAYVGGGFGSKGEVHSHEVAAALAARSLPGRAVSLAMTRQQLFSTTGYRPASISRFRLGARADGTLTAIEHQVFEESSRIRDYAEQTASPTRMMYAAPNRRTSHRLALLDVNAPSWMRAPGEMPGMFAHEVAMDELAVATGLDPIALRERNEPERDPETGLPWNNRRLIECLHRGAERFGWADRPAEPGTVTDGEWWVGTGVAAATYPAMRMPGNQARVTSLPHGRYAVAIGAVDIGTGARTALAQIAADALGCEVEDVDLQIADSSLPSASVAGGSSGTSSWGSAITAAAQQFRADHGEHPDPGLHTTAAAAEESPTRAMHSFGAVFAETRVHRWTGEVRVPRLLGVYSVGRVVNPLTARSQLLGGLVMGLSAALLEDAHRDPRTGHVVTQDLATYHVATHADVVDVQAEWLDEEDLLANPMGSRGIGEIGIVGTSAAILNAAYHATGTRVRELPISSGALFG